MESQVQSRLNFKGGWLTTRGYLVTLHIQIYFCHEFKFRGVQTQSSWYVTQPGFLSYQADRVNLRSHRKPGQTAIPEDWVWTPLDYIYILHGFHWTLEHPWVQITIQSVHFSFPPISTDAARLICWLESVWIKLLRRRPEKQSMESMTTPCVTIA